LVAASFTPIFLLLLPLDHFSAAADADAAFSHAIEIERLDRRPFSVSLSVPEEEEEEEEAKSNLGIW
jgi:hypothetical protein